MVIKRFVVVLIVMVVFIGCGSKEEDLGASTTDSLVGSSAGTVVDSQPAAFVNNDAITSTPLAATASVAADVVEATSADGSKVALDGSGSEFPVGAEVAW